MTANDGRADGAPDAHAASKPLSVGPVTVPAGPAADAARSAGRSAGQAARVAAKTGSDLLTKLREAAARRRQQRSGHRPAGTPSASGPSRPRPRSTAPGPAAAVLAPFTQAADAVRERWHDAVREGKLAAREKEAQIRADYESRVRHSPRLHAEQHNLQERRRD